MLSRRICLQISKSVDLKKKEVEDVLGGPDSWKGAPKTDGRLKGDCLSLQQFGLLQVHKDACRILCLHVCAPCLACDIRLVMLLFILLLLLQQRARNVDIIKRTSMRYR